MQQRTSDRSWKSMWAVLKDETLFLYREKTSTVSTTQRTTGSVCNNKQHLISVRHRLLLQISCIMIVKYK